MFMYHNDQLSEHIGIKKNYKKIVSRILWPKILNSVYKYINSCWDFQTQKPVHKLLIYFKNNSNRTVRKNWYRLSWTISKIEK